MTPLKSPMQNLNRTEKTSSLTTMKKFLRTVNSSYSDEYFTRSPALLPSVFAMLTVLETESTTASPLTMSSFLRRQLGLYELGSKCLVDASRVQKFEANGLARNARKAIKLKTNSACCSSEIKASFIEFIDQNSECMCPILMSHGMVLELEVNGKFYFHCWFMKAANYRGVN